VDGEIRSSEWTDKDSGVTRRMLYVAAQKIIYLGKANGQPGEPGGNGSGNGRRCSVLKNVFIAWTGGIVSLTGSLLKCIFKILGELTEDLRRI
jgi:hypothetical protein